MFIGHFAPAFAAAAVSPRAPKLATLFVAAQLIDWAFFTFAILGIEKMRIDPQATVMVPYDLYFYPYTHSLLGAAIWGAVFALIVWISKKNLFAGILVGLVVLSHWLLDLVVHRPDLTLAGNGETYGFGLWNYPYVAMPLELGITIAAFVFYVRRTRGPIGPPLVLMSVLLILQAINWFGPEPQSADIFLHGQALLAFGVLTLIAWWVGDNRWYNRKGGLASSNL